MVVDGDEEAEGEEDTAVFVSLLTVDAISGVQLVDIVGIEVSWVYRQLSGVATVSMATRNRDGAKNCPARFSLKMSLYGCLYVSSSLSDSSKYTGDITEVGLERNIRIYNLQSCKKS